ncbi:MAG: VTT domain-containing protein [Aureispira sp.]|nr:VTT domain-containing protein [Aureispira sp.]
MSKSEKRIGVGLRLLILVAIIVSLILVGKFTPLGEYFSVTKLKELINGAGWWGLLIFLGFFIAGAIMNLPGTAFLVFALWIFGYWKGASITYLAAVIAAMITFYFARFVGGKALTEIKSPFVKRLLGKAESRPIFTLVVLRVLIQFSPLVGYTLALTNIKPYQYFIGNIIGMLVPLGYLTFGYYVFEDYFIALLG